MGKNSQCLKILALEMARASTSAAWPGRN